MTVTIEGAAKEFADLVVAIQGQQIQDNTVLMNGQAISPQETLS